MNLKDQVTNLELSIKLKDIGINQSSLFYWIKKKEEKDDAYGIIYVDQVEDVVEGNINDYDCYSAFIATELLEILPKDLDVDDHTDVALFELVNLEKINQLQKDIRTLALVAFNKTLFYESTDRDKLGNIIERTKHLEENK